MKVYQCRDYYVMEDDKTYYCEKTPPAPNARWVQLSLFNSVFCVPSSITKVRSDCKRLF